MSIKKKVKCVETGQVFDSINDAGDHFGVNYQNISNAITGKSRTSCGYHWILVKDEEQSRKPSMTIQQVLEEARRRTEETGKFVSYADIQRENTLRMIRERDEKRSVCYG